MPCSERVLSGTFTCAYFLMNACPSLQETSIQSFTFTCATFASIFVTHPVAHIRYHRKEKRTQKCQKITRLWCWWWTLFLKAFFYFCFWIMFFLRIYLITKFAKCPHSRASLTLTAETSSSSSHILGWNTFSRMFMARHLLHLKYTFLMFMKFLHPFPRQWQCIARAKVECFVGWIKFTEILVNLLRFSCFAYL